MIEPRGERMIGCDERELAALKVDAELRFSVRGWNDGYLADIMGSKLIPLHAEPSVERQDILGSADALASDPDAIHAEEEDDAADQHARKHPRRSFDGKHSHNQCSDNYG